jgi:hypothetical protein
LTYVNLLLSRVRRQVKLESKPALVPEMRLLRACMHGGPLV